MTLDVALQLRIGTLDLAVDLAVGEEVVAILGPNGAGKTSLLRAIAGLVSIDRGRIAIDGTDVDDPTAGVYLPPERRPIGMVFQDYLLFPFLTARENVAFPLRSRRVPKARARAQADEWLARVGLADRADARPSELSGGQAQRVALARALASNPRVLLLDEPLAALDAGARIEIRRELRQHLADAPGARLLVTHDAVDASVLADRVVVLEGGRIVQSGPMAEIALHPRSDYVADLVGLNLYRGRARDGVVTLDGTGAGSGAASGVAGGGEIVVADHQITGSVYVSFHPRGVAVHLELPHGSTRNHWQGTVVDIDNLGDRVRLRIDGPVPSVAEITREAAHEMGVRPGTQVFAAVKATEIRVYPA